MIRGSPARFPTRRHPRWHGIPDGRFQLRRASDLGAAFDGVWWPRTRALTDELHTIIPIVDFLRGEVIAVRFNRRDWDTPHGRAYPNRTVALESTATPADEGTVVFVGRNHTATFALINPRVGEKAGTQAMAAALAQRRTLR